MKKIIITSLLTIICCTAGYCQETKNTQRERLTQLIYIRDSLIKSNEFDRALCIADEIIEFCKSHFPKKVAARQMEKSDIYKDLYELYNKEIYLRNNIDCEKKAFEYYKQYGNDVKGLYELGIVDGIIADHLFANDYKGAIQYYESVEPQIKTLEYYDLKYQDINEQQLAITLANHMYIIYSRIGKFQSAVLQAKVLERHYFFTEDVNCNVNTAEWADNKVAAHIGVFRIENDYNEINKIHDALVFANQTWEAIENHEHYDAFGRHLNVQGEYAELLGEYDKAEKFYSQAIDFCENKDNLQDLAIYLRQNLATCQAKNGKVDLAISELKDIESISIEKNDLLKLSIVYRDYAYIYTYYYKDFAKAEKYANMSYDCILKNRGNLADIIKTMNILYETYLYIGLKESALGMKMQIIKSKKDIGIENEDDMLDLFSLYINLKDLNSTDSDDVSIRQFIERHCKELLPTITGTDKKSKYTKWWALSVLSTLYMHTMRNTEANILLEEQFVIAKDVGGTNSSIYKTTLNNIVVNSIIDKDYEKGLKYSMELLKHEDADYVYTNLITCALALKDINLIEQYISNDYNKSYNYVKNNFSFLSSEQREEIINTYTGRFSYRLTLPAAMFPNSGVCCEYAYNSALVSKGLLLGTGRNIAETIMESGDSTLIANQNVLRTMQQQLQTCNDSARIVSLNRDIATVEKEISESLQAYADFTRDIDLTWRDVQQRLTDNETAVEFVIIDPRALTHPTDTTVYYGAMLLNKNFEAPKFVPLSAKNATDDIIRQLSYEAGRGEAADEANITSLSRSLNDFIWQPITTCITPGNRVSFAPVSMLSIAPLEYLTDSTDTPICDRYDMRRLSSTRELCKDRSTKPGDNAVLYGGLIYDNGSTTDSISTTRSKRAGWRYLPHTAEEVDSITLILKGAGYDVTTHKGMDGSEEVFRSMSGKDIDILHVATHGFYFNEDESATLDFFKDLNIPVRRNMSISNLMRSGLLLSGGQQAWLGGKADATDGNDGVALSSEISLLDLHNVSLVTLSACQTGQGDISADGVVGLQRGFKMAGAESILMTLWDVNDDATRLFMTSFYRHLAAGKDKHEALRQAQTDLRHYDNGRYDAPRYWAAFILLE